MRCSKTFLPVHQAGYFPGQDGLGRGPALGRLVCFFNSIDLRHRQEGEILQEFVYIRIGRINPELIKGIDRSSRRIKPDSAFFGLAELAAVRLDDQGERQAEDLLLIEAPGQVDAGRDVAPLVGATKVSESAPKSTRKATLAFNSRSRRSRT